MAFDLEGHGREDVIEEVDISRTVGWFTTIFPVVFQVPGDKDIAAQIKYVKEKLRDMPYKGFNYNVLKYLKNVDLNISTGISFNYLGQVLEPDEINDTFFLVKKELPGTIDSKNLRPNFIDIICIVVDGRLRVDFNYSTNKHAKESVEKLASMYRDDLLNVMAHCLDPENYDVTPSDFNLLDVDQDTLDNLSEFE